MLTAALRYIGKAVMLGLVLAILLIWLPRLQLLPGSNHRSVTLMLQVRPAQLSSIFIPAAFRIPH
mgnify:CR=1 FL=1